MEKELRDMRVFIDSSVILDAATHSGSQYEDSKYLLMLGYTSEVELWMSPMHLDEVLNFAAEVGRYKFHYSHELRRAVNVAQLSSKELDSAEARHWVDFNAAVAFDLALSIRADMIVSNDTFKYIASSIPVFSSSQFVDYLKETILDSNM
jgi:predicted nucleic acid-binding protein